jgi:transcriptional regulator with XRE-family HTH domain
MNTLCTRRLKLARDAAGLSAEQLGKLAGVSSATVLRYESGATSVSLTALGAYIANTEATYEWLHGAGPDLGAK